MDTEPVIDASAIVAAVAPEEQSEWALKQIGNHRYFHILDLTYYEVSNSLKNKIIKKKLTEQQAIAIFDQAMKFMNLCEVHSFIEIIDDAMKNVIELDVTSYDMSYLCLSKNLVTKFITTDVKLVDKLKGTEYHKLIEYPKKA
jgi:predicted nucleic acid-binding protein